MAIVLLLALAACGGDRQAVRPGARPSLGVADAALSGGAPAIALQVANDVLVRNPSSVEALVRRGDALSALGQHAEAEASYTRALSHHPTSGEAMLGLGRLRLASDPAASERLFLGALELKPRHAAALNNLGIARDLQGRHTEAQAAYAKAITEAPGMSAAQVNMGLSLALAGNAERAIQMLRPLASEPVAPRRVRHNLAAAMAIGGDASGAERILGSDLPEDQAKRALEAFRALNGGAAR